MTVTWSPGKLVGKRKSPRRKPASGSEEGELPFIPSLATNYQNELRRSPKASEPVFLVCKVDFFFLKLFIPSPEL